MQYIKTDEKVEVKNYPYGGLRTTLFDTMEFNPNKGYRHVTQTINPKNGRENKPKKSTYSPFLIRYYDENNHIKTTCIDMNTGVEGINKIAKFYDENFNLFSPAEIEYAYAVLINYSRISMKATHIYSGAEVKDLIPLFDDSVKTLVQGFKSKGTENVFNKVFFNKEAIDSVCPKDFNPFKVKSYGTT